jgi:plastocyanin
MGLSRYLGIGALLAGVAFVSASGCSSAEDKTSTGGTGGATGGSGGATGGSGGATGGSGGATGGSGGGGASNFMAIEPCQTEDAYMAGTTINVAPATFKYAPACLKVAKGATVKFTSDFAMHPLEPSKTRGNTADNPIMKTTTGTEASFTFSKPGIYGYFCGFHGVSDNGKNMAGAIWVTP